MRKTVNMGNDEPEQISFLLPSEGEHLLEVSEFLPSDDENIVIVKCEVISGLEAGRSLIQRVSLNQEWKGFFTTRLFLKAIGELYKGDIEIDTDNWFGRRFYAFVIHTKSKKNGKTYANIDSYNFEKKIEQYKPPVKLATETIKEEDIQWGADNLEVIKDPSEIKFQD